MPPRLHRARRLVARALALSLLALVLLAAAACPRAAHLLIIDEPLHRADAIVVLAGARVERWLEATDLYREGFAPALVLSSGIIEPAEEQLRERGIEYPRETDLSRSAMVQMGIPAAAITVFPESVDNTAHEATQAHHLARERGWRSIIVVTSKYHTRRARYAFERELGRSGITVQVRGSRYDDAQPDRWWKSRSDFRFVTWEIPKLVAYRLGLGE